MRRPAIIRHFLIGLLFGTLLLPPTAQAQWTGFDTAQYTLQFEKKIEEATRWVQTITHYAQIYEKAAQQVTTLGGILKTTEDLIAKQRNMIVTMSNIGQTVR